MSDKDLEGRFFPIEHPGCKVLYSAATGLEKALADTDAERTIRIPDWLIVDQWDAYLISYNNLPYLGYAMGVTLWEGIWNESTRREWVANQWTYKSLRGTPDGIRYALRPSGYSVTDMVRPEQGFWISPNLSKEKYDAWIRLMPELVIKFKRRQGKAGIDELYMNDGFLDHSHLCLDDGWALWGREAVIRQGDKETPVYGIEYHHAEEERGAKDFERFSTGGKSSFGLFLDVDFADNNRFLSSEEITPKIVTLEFDRTYSHDKSTLSLTTVMPDLEPMSPRYERVSDIGNAGPYFHLDIDVLDDARFFPGHDDGANLLSDRVYLHDPAVAAPMNEGLSFLDHDRLGIWPFTAEVQIDLKTKEPTGRILFADDSFLDDTSHLMPEDPSHRDRAHRAVVDAKALRDTVFLGFDPKRLIAAGDYLKDNAMYGDWIANRL